MFKRFLTLVLVPALLITGFSACGLNKTAKIGVSFGAGPAVRWDHEKEYMEAHAKEIGADIEIRLNRTDEPKTQTEDCIEMIDSGIDVLILMPRKVDQMSEILAYAKKKNVPVISYARAILGEKVDLYVGYDSNRIGQKMGQYLSELVYEGDYILLEGDPGDNNALMLYEGAMRYIDPIKDSIHIILEEAVVGWSADEAKRLVTEAITNNGNHVDAILAPNDTIAGACAEVVAELGLKNHVVITGMDADLAAAQRIVAGTQDMTVYMDLKELANIAVDEAYHMATGQTVNVNAAFDNKSGSTIDANLITGQMVTKENLDRLLIDSGYFTKEEVYGS